MGESELAPPTAPEDGAVEDLIGELVLQQATEVDVGAAGLGVTSAVLLENGSNLGPVEPVSPIDVPSASQTSDASAAAAIPLNQQPDGEGSKTEPATEFFTTDGSSGLSIATKELSTLQLDGAASEEGRPTQTPTTSALSAATEEVSSLQSDGGAHMAGSPTEVPTTTGSSGLSAASEEVLNLQLDGEASKAAASVRQTTTTSENPSLSAAAAEESPTLQLDGKASNAIESAVETTTVTGSSGFSAATEGLSSLQPHGEVSKAAEPAPTTIRSSNLSSAAEEPLNPEPDRAASNVAESETENPTASGIPNLSAAAAEEWSTLQPDGGANKAEPAAETATTSAFSDLSATAERLPNPQLVGGAKEDGTSGTDAELLSRQKTKEQELVTSVEVMQRLERIDTRIRMGVAVDETRGETADSGGEVEQQAEEQEENPQYYDPASLAPPTGPHELPSDTGRLLCSFGLEASKRGAMDYIAEDLLVFPAANTVQTLNVKTGVQEQLQVAVGQGVSTIVVHPSRRWIAICERGVNPSVIIYTFPTLQLYKILRGGTERSFGCAVFSHDGRELATVGGYPDYWLTVWEWRNESIKLRAKAFSQDVFKVCFSPSFAGQLITSGTGHIRFWRMAATFTGLKLQGQLGKFGAVPLSDISGFVELPDGKVLSGTESGRLLLWDGGFIKCEITRPGGIPCHLGNVECVQLDSKRRQLITAGHDGYARVWDFDALDGADQVDGKATFEMVPLEENLIGEGVRCKTLLREEDHWIVQDERGALLRVALPTFRSTRLLEFHSGAITGLDTHPRKHLMATTGEDATVRLYSYVEGAQKQVCARAFRRAARCCAWAPEGRTLLVGFEDGVLRALARARDGWRLAQVVKPHTGAISCLALSIDGCHLATASTDGTVFFFQSRDSAWAPIGYFVAPGPLNCATWQADSQKLLIGCRTGQILEVTRPTGDEDTSRTLALDLPSTPFDFLAARRAAAAAAEAATRDEAAKKRAEEDPDGTVSEEEPSAAAAAAATMIEDPPAVGTILRHESDANLFSVSFRGGKHPGLFVCDLRGGGILEERLSDAGEVRGVSLSRDARFLAVGGEDGEVRVQPWGIPPRGSEKGWRARAHDSACLAAASFDGAFLLSGGSSGVLLVHRLALEAVTEQSSAPESASVDSTGREVDDVTADDAYSLEDAKQKEEEDKLHAAAVRRQLSVKEQLAEIRRELKEEIERNRGLPTGHRVPAEEMEVDPGLRSMMAAEVESHVVLAHRELEWDTEKATVALNKLRHHFLDPLETERIVVDALSSGRHVSTFEAVRLSPETQAEIAALEAAEILRRQPSGMMTPGSRRRTRDAQGIPATPTLQNSPSRSPQLTHSADSIRETREETAAGKQAQRKKQREMREKQWANFNKTRPDPAYENPADMAAIQAGWDTMGDFKLKSDPDYVVPEAQRIDAGKKHAQMLRLTSAMHAHTRAFNSKVLSLRARREGARGALEADVERVRAINKLLGLDKPPLFVWHSNPRERPEAREEVSERDLAEFRKQQRQAERDAKNKGSSGFGGFGGQTAAASEAEVTEEPGPLSPTALNTLDQASGGKAASTGKENTPRQDRKGREYRKSDLEVAEQDAAERRLRHEKATLAAKTQRVIDGFDADVDQLRVEKLELKAKLKAADGRMLVMQKELELLKEFEKKDHVLKSRSAAKKAEQEELEAKADELDSKLEAKQAELSTGAQAKADLLGEFDRLIEPGHPHRDALLKVYNKKVKRIKKKENSRGEDEDDDDTDDDDSDDDDMDEDEEGDTCPIGCERAAYEHVCQLRERRLDQDDVMADVAKVMEALKREQDALAKKLKAVDAAARAVEKEMDDFQKEKQGALNQIDVPLTLRLHQIQHLLPDGQLPADLSSALVFSNAALARLGGRVRELGDEKNALRAAQRDLHKQHSALYKQKREKEKKIADLQQRAVDVQMLKFGQVIDLKLLEAVGDSAGAEELRASLAEQERVHVRELGEWKRAIDHATDVLADVTAENTSCLNRAAELGEQHQLLEQRLVATQHTVLADAVSLKRKEAEERDRLVQVVNDQAGDLERLKAEIRVLKSKGPIRA